MTETWFRFEVNPAMLPRSTTRAQWKAMYRWLRVASREVARQIEIGL